MSALGLPNGVRARAALAVAAALLLAGCAVGPDFKKPAPPQVTGYASPMAPLPAKTASADVPAGDAQRFVEDRDVPGDWWTLFHSKALDALVEEALKANPDLAAAQAALREARENVAAEDGALFPTVKANGGLSRQKSSLAQSGTKLAYSLYNANVAVSYAPDVFGGTRREIESLEAEADYQRFQLEATYLTLTSNVTAAAMQEASLRAQIEATREIVKDESAQLDVVKQQFELGGVSRADVLSQQSTLAQTEATLPPLEKSLAQERNQIMAYTGRYPSQDQGGRFELAALTLPGDLPVSLPSKLVEQRPDVRAAEAQLHAASAEIGVAIANELPQFAIGAGYGGAGSTIANLFSPANIVWSIAGSAAQTIFDGGTLLHKRRAADAAFDQAAAQYRSTVLAAFQNVADALRALQYDAVALKADTEAERAAADSLELSREQFKAGAVTYLTLLNAEQAYQNTRITLVKAEAARFTDTVALFQALGGGWWHRADVAARGE
ncbi:MAG TPA: efflux transporter outer membrane subunit [Alphaproteobacteria bacterium]|nr:efflux transporter outer membrane subunit [Alphaproteobacteria bacterium]